MRPIASDLNGTYTDFPEIRGEVNFIVTAETWRTWKDVKELSDGLPVYLNPGRSDLMDIVAHKANVINKMNISKFYENQKEQVMLLKTMCPNCRIVLVEKGRFAF